MHLALRGYETRHEFLKGKFTLFDSKAGEN